MKLALVLFVLAFSFNSFAAVFPVRGSVDAPVTVIVFGDYQCPFTQRTNQFVGEILQEMSSQVKYVFRHYPLDFHDNARLASKTALCAQDQGHFWEIHDLLFSVNGSQLSPSLIREFAVKAKLDLQKLDDCVSNSATEARVVRELAEGDLIQVTGTPHMLIVGPGGSITLRGSYPIDDVKAAIKQALTPK